MMHVCSHIFYRSLVNSEITFGKNKPYCIWHHGYKWKQRVVQQTSQTPDSDDWYFIVSFYIAQIKDCKGTRMEHLFLKTLCKSNIWYWNNFSVWYFFLHWDHVNCNSCICGLQYWNCQDQPFNWITVFHVTLISPLKNVSFYRSHRKLIVGVTVDILIIDVQMHELYYNLAL